MEVTQPFPRHHAWRSRIPLTHQIPERSDVKKKLKKNHEVADFLFTSYSHMFTPRGRELHPVESLNDETIAVRQAQALSESRRGVMERIGFSDLVI